MRHARTGTVQTADRVPFEDLLEPTELTEVSPVHALIAVSAEPAETVEAWSWPEAPGLPPTPTLKRGMPSNPLPPRTHARVLPAADQPRRALPRLRSFRGPSPTERYGLPPTTVATHQAAPAPSRARGPLIGLLATAVVGASWIALAGVTGYSLGLLAVVLGAVVGLTMLRFGRPGGEENVFFAVVWSIVGAFVGFFAVAVQANMTTLGVSAGEAIAGSRWNAIVNDVMTAPLNWLYVVLAVVAAVSLVRRPRRG